MIDDDGQPIEPLTNTGSSKNYQGGIRVKIKVKINWNYVVKEMRGILIHVQVVFLFLMMNSNDQNEVPK